MKQERRKYWVLLVIKIIIFHPGFTQTISRINMMPLKVVYVTDTAQTIRDLPAKFGKGYGSLFTFIGDLKLKPGRVMAIYHRYEEPLIFDIAVEVDQAPGLLRGGIQFKLLEGGDAIVIHLKGPYEELGEAYELLGSWLRKNNKKAAGPPFEVF